MRASGSTLGASLTWSLDTTSTTSCSPSSREPRIGAKLCRVPNRPVSTRIHSGCRVWSSRYTLVILPILLPSASTAARRMYCSLSCGVVMAVSPLLAGCRAGRCPGHATRYKTCRATQRGQPQTAPSYDHPLRIKNDRPGLAMAVYRPCSDLGSRRWWTQVGVSDGQPIPKCAGTQDVQSDLRCG